MTGKAGPVTFACMHVTTTPHATTDLEMIFRALAEPTRLRILNLLQDGELCVCELVSVLDVPQPTASRHLAYLRKAGLVIARKEGLWHYYRLLPTRTKFYKKLWECVQASADEVPQLVADVERLRRVERPNCCE